MNGLASLLPDRAGIISSQKPFSPSDMYELQSRGALGTAQFTSAQTPMPVSEMLPTVDMYSHEWFDPLGPLDFSNFAQIGMTDSTLGFGYS
jgi:hypothetical protein